MHEDGLLGPVNVMPKGSGPPDLLEIVGGQGQSKCLEGAGKCSGCCSSQEELFVRCHFLVGQESKEGPHLNASRVDPNVAANTCS